MWQFIGLDENGDYKFIHPDFGKNTVGKFSELNPAGVQSAEHALEIINSQIYTE